MAATTVKISYDDELRRFRLAANGSSWAGLQQTVRALFNVPADASIALKYTDADGDLITLSSDVELAEAVSDAAAAGQPVRLALTVASPSGRATPPAVASPAKAAAADKGKAPADDSQSISAPTGSPRGKVIKIEVTGNDNEQHEAPATNPPPARDPTATSDGEPTTSHAAAPDAANPGSGHAESAREPPPPADDPFNQMQALLDEFMPRLIGDVLGEPAPSTSGDSTSAPSSAETAAPSDPAPEPKYVHWGVECDRCHSTVVGKRYKCRACRDYDLCEDCYTPGDAPQEGHDPAHAFAHVPHPMAFLPPSSGEFAQRFADIMPGLMRRLSADMGGNTRGCGNAWARRAHCHRGFQRGCHPSMGPAFMFM